jgi:hypothetical protein
MQGWLADTDSGVVIGPPPENPSNDDSSIPPLPPSLVSPAASQVELELETIFLEQTAPDVDVYIRRWEGGHMGGQRHMHPV